MNYAIIRSGSKQYQVKVGSIVKLELLASAPGPVIFEDVLLYVDGDKVEIGTPTITDFKVYGTILGEVKADKVQVFKYKSKSRYRKLRGHRQRYAEVKIESLGTPIKKEVVKKAAKPPVKKVTPKKSPKKVVKK